MLSLRQILAGHLVPTSSMVSTLQSSSSSEPHIAKSDMSVASLIFPK